MRCVDWNCSASLYNRGIVVASLMRCVDWNLSSPINLSSTSVASLMRCVDWNITPDVNAPKNAVASLMRCVDWNLIQVFEYVFWALSHRSCGAWIEIYEPHRPIPTVQSHRSCGAWIEIPPRFPTCFQSRSHRSCGAWIEIVFYGLPLFAHVVASLMRCVDWNVVQDAGVLPQGPSHRSCGAWIEMFPRPQRLAPYLVASLMRCVDWNMKTLRCTASEDCRIAHAVRGLKSATFRADERWEKSHRSCGAWIEILSWSSDISYSLVASLTRLQWILIQFSAKKAKKEP